MNQEMTQDIERSVEGDKKISIAIMSSFAILILQYLILGYFNIRGTLYATRIQILSKIFVGFFYLIALPIVLERNKRKFIIIYAISILIFAFNYIFFTNNRIYLKSIIFPFFFTCIPSLIYSYSINDWKVLKKVMEKVSILIFIVGSIIATMVFTKTISIGRYSMPLAYYMLLPTTVYANELLEKFNIKSFIITFISLFIILALGSRGPIACIGVFVILKLITKKKDVNYKTISIFLMIVAIGIIILSYFDIILESLYDFLLRFEIRSRSIELFLKDEIYLSGREFIYEDVIQGIKENPIVGIGLVGDRQVTGGRYSHNIIIEIIANFGIIVGSILIILLTIMSFKTLFSKNKEFSNFIAIWLSVGVVHLLLSSSYLIDFKFWIFLGLVIRAVKNEEIYS